MTMNTAREFARAEVRNEAVNSYRRVGWRQLQTGSTVWAPWAGGYNIPAESWPYGWRPAIVTALGKNISKMAETANATRGTCAGANPDLCGKDKPPIA
jgi:hypothetical protein